MFRVDSLELSDERRGQEFFYNGLSNVIFLPELYNAYNPSELKLVIKGDGFGNVMIGEKGDILGRVTLTVELLKFRNDEVLWWSSQFLESQVPGAIIVHPTEDTSEGCCGQTVRTTRYMPLNEYNRIVNDILKVTDWSNDTIKCDFRSYMAPLYGGKYRVQVVPNPEIPQEDQNDELGKTHFYIDSGPDLSLNILTRRQGENFVMASGNKIPAIPALNTGYEFTPTSGIWIYPALQPTELILRNRDDFFDLKYQWKGALSKDIHLRYYGYITPQGGFADDITMSNETPNLESPFPGVGTPQIPELNLNRYDGESIVRQNRVKTNPNFPYVGLRTTGLTYNREIIRQLPIDYKGFRCKIYTADWGTYYDDRFSLMIKKGPRWPGDNEWFDIPVNENESTNNFRGNRELLCHDFFIDPNAEETIIRLVYQDISNITGSDRVPSHTPFIGFGGALRASDIDIPVDIINGDQVLIYGFADQSEFANAPSDGYVFEFQGEILDIKIKNLI